MIKPLVAACACFIFSSSVWAEVNIESPEELVIVAINDQQVKNSILRGNVSTYKLDSGNHQVSVKYQQIFIDNYITHEIVRSNIVTLNTGILQDGTYRLTLVNPPKDLDEAKRFADQPVIALTDSTGNIVAQQAGATSKAKPWFGSGIFSNTVDLRAEDTPKPSEEAKSIQGNSKAAMTAHNTVASAAGALAKDQQLIQLWNSASSQERRKFSAWLAEQAAK